MMVWGMIFIHQPRGESNPSFCSYRGAYFHTYSTAGVAVAGYPTGVTLAVRNYSIVGGDWLGKPVGTWGNQCTLLVSSVTTLPAIMAF